MTTSHDLPTILERTAAMVADNGIDAVDLGLIDTVAARALMLGASPVLVDVLVDRDEPAVARVRAFGRLALVAARPVDHRFALAA